MNGMDDGEDETDLFDDDEFDNLSETALQELEHHAILSTQQARAATIKPQPLPTTTAIPQARTLAQVQYGSRVSIPNPGFPKHLLEDEDSFELIGEEGVATPVEEHDSFSFPRPQPGETAQRELWRQQRYGQSYVDLAPQKPQPLQSSHRPLPSAIPYRPQNGFNPGSYGGPSAAPSQPAPLTQSGERVTQNYRLEDLLRERDDLARELQATKDSISMQKGEISIVRANFEKESKVYDRQIGALKKTMEEESAKHTAALHALTEKNNNLTTRYNFLQQEHNQELQETRTLQQRLKDRPVADRDASPIATPKRGMGSSIRDGFNDDDIMLMSPSKSARRSKPTTPTATNKRKRKAGDPSPVNPLVLRPSQNDMPPPAPVLVSEAVEKVVSIVRKDKQAERHLKFLQSVLEYRVRDPKTPLLETLIQFSLPSAPAKTFSSIVLEGTAQLEGPRLPGDLLQLFLNLWSKCLNEQYYKPIAVLLEIVKHITELDLEIFDADIIGALVPLLQTSISINAEKRFKHSPVNHATYGKIRQTPQSVLNQAVKGMDCMDLLLTMAYTISDEPDLLSLLWRLLSPEFVLMMLNAWQPIADITLMLQLLATSIFPTTFGNICDAETQSKVEHYILNRICYLLWETPKTDEGLDPYTPEQLCNFRIEVMDFLTHLGITSSPPPHDDPTHHGSVLLANDAHAIARLIRFLYDTVSSLYTLHPLTHPLHSHLINSTVRLLHHILTLHASTINLQEKLQVINGGVHKHRVVLTRLAFSEGWVIDRSVSDETVAMATGLLEESVTPDEADLLIAAFPKFRGRGVRDEDGEIRRGNDGDGNDDETMEEG
jgi:hypothetical protein